MRIPSHQIFLIIKFINNQASCRRVNAAAAPPTSIFRPPPSPLIQVDTYSEENKLGARSQRRVSCVRSYVISWATKCAGFHVIVVGSPSSALRTGNR